ncbi:MAG: HPr family phosphocarrier protein [Elusimicrobiota bacterium]|jgi:phosphotransferase system HPr (HPr) family protein|nr:HPr family phosphocarrier protein [Elusimicrobiota bacterium]
MKEKIIVVNFKKGLHARPAAELVGLLSKYQSNIKIIKDDFIIDAKSIMGVLMLAAAHGTDLKFISEGVDEEIVLENIESFFNSGKEYD